MLVETRLSAAWADSAQMTGGGRAVALGPCHQDSMHPDLDWLEAELSGPRPPKLVVLINPCNPTGELPRGDWLTLLASLAKGISMADMAPSAASGADSV